MILPTEIAVPFRIDANGSIGHTDEPARLAAQHLASAIGTRPGERVMRPEYGSLVQQFEFSTGDADDLAGIEDTVRAAAQAYVTDADVVGVQVQRTDEDGLAPVLVQFRVRATGTLEETVVARVQTAVRTDGVVTELEGV